MSAATTLLVAVCATGMGLYVVAWVIVCDWWAGQRRRQATAAGGVSILKPLCGLDEELERNLVSFFSLDHEPLQLVFGVADAGDPALAIVRRLARQHPHRDVAIIVGHDDGAASPKVGVLEMLLPHARHGIILLSDSNVRIGPDDVGRVLAGFADPHVGMVYQAVVGVGERALPAAVENLHYTEIAGFLSIAAVRFAGQHVVNGKGQWIRREALDAIGGFVGVRDVGADDYVLAQLVAAAGWRLRLAPIPVRIVHREWSWRAAVQRHLRHSGMRRQLCPWAYPLELLLNPLPLALPLLATGAAPLVPLVVVLKVTLEVTMARMLRGEWTSWRHVACLPLKDLFYWAGWFASFSTRTVSWRGRTYALGAGTRLVPVAEAAPALLGERSAAA
jgi:ceramide glucosyltransferase